jgi:hypothetical protein
MEEHYVTFETAQLAKEKGFWETHGFPAAIFTKDGKPSSSCLITPEDYQRPPQTFLQQWLREVHSIHIYIQTTPRFDKLQGSKWRCSIKYCFQPFKWTTGHYYLGDTYEEALEKGLQNALKFI